MASPASIYDKPGWDFTPTMLIRNGDMVHLWGCPHAGRKWVPWNWAEREGMGEAMRVPWLKKCGHCFGKASNTDREPS
jgi:hypothetical protein